MHEAHPAPMRPPAVASRGTSRRWFLAGGAAVLLAGGGGAVAALARTEQKKPGPAPLPPAALVAAVGAERRLIADLDATTGGTPAVRRVIRQARADHAAHLHALTELLAGFRTAPTPSPTPRPRGTPRTRTQLQRAELSASAAAARRAADLSGGYAALLASIAACEATHAELLR